MVQRLRDEQKKTNPRCDLRLPSVYEKNGTLFKDIFNSEPYKQLRRTVNDDSVEKYYAYCEKCEMRHGRAQEASHLGDETWLDALRHNGNLIDIEVNHHPIPQTLIT